jgi:hypothetical protein
MKSTRSKSPPKRVLELKTETLRRAQGGALGGGGPAPPAFEDKTLTSKACVGGQ